MLAQLFGSLIIGAFSAYYFTGGKSPLVYPEEMTGVLSIKDENIKRPNIIIILADDMGYGDIGAYGTQAIKTPHIDSLAEQGIKFTDFHSSAALCTPSRTGLLTGRYSDRTGLNMAELPDGYVKRIPLKAGQFLGWIGVTDGATVNRVEGLPQKEITIAKALKTRNYETAMVGKWHLGNYLSNPEFNPRNYGFDHYFGVPYSNDMHPFSLYRNFEQLEDEVADQSTLTRRYTEEAQEFIKASAEKDSPFFLYFAHTFPHRPVYASENFRHKSDGGAYGDSVEEIDWSVGELVKTLEEYKLNENTLIIFTSDNGPWYQGDPGHHRGRKGQSYEGGFRVPFIAKFPGHIKAGSVCMAPAMNIDLFPTILSLAGINLPEDRIVDGKNITGLLTQEDFSSTDRFLYYYHLGKLEAVRWGDWKYFSKINDYVWPAPVNQKLGFVTTYSNGPDETLYNLKTDPSESYNLIDEHPEIVSKLKKAFQDWEQHMKENELGIQIRKKAAKQSH